MTHPVTLHVAYPNRWGPGKTHIAGGPYRDTLCAPFIHGHRERGQLSDVTCKRCLRMINRWHTI